MRPLSTTEKAEAYDALMQNIEARKPSVELIVGQARGYTETGAFFWAFDKAIDRLKRAKLAN